MILDAIAKKCVDRATATRPAPAAADTLIHQRRRPAERMPRPLRPQMPPRNRPQLAYTKARAARAPRHPLLPGPENLGDFVETNDTGGVRGKRKGRCTAEPGNQETGFAKGQRAPANQNIAAERIGDLIVDVFSARVPNVDASPSKGGARDVGRLQRREGILSAM